ncbi:MAG: Na/Pi cotransporter family protein [Acetobacteraceae bacterium]|nr:Na/Pi cotransporter family protein [Acetobacteraceae bacterium]
MAEIWVLLRLAGAAALLLWGLHMVQSGVQRAFGSRLRDRLGVALGTPRRALLAGIGITAALQSSTATALMVSSFAASGAVALVPGLAAMLGANIGTALVVQVLAFDTGALASLLVLGGVIAFRRGRGAKLKDYGRVAIGLGLMLMALHLIVEAVQPIESSPNLRLVLHALADLPLVNLALAALIAWAAHSSLAAVLFVSALAAQGVLVPEQVIAMVAGANLGTALNPLLEGGGDARDPSRLRLPMGNLATRLGGAALTLVLLPWLGAAMEWSRLPQGQEAALVHLAFNLAVAALAYPLLPATARLLERVFPERAGDADEGMPRHLDPAALRLPSVALAHAAREVLRLADLTEAMLAAAGSGRQAEKPAARLAAVSARLQAAILAYLAALPEELLSASEASRRDDLRHYALTLDHLAEAIAQGLLRPRWEGASPAAQIRIGKLVEGLRAQLALGLAVVMQDDAEAARRLVRDKEALREMERDAVAAPEEPAVLAALRGARLVSGAIAALGQPLLERRGELRPSRLVPED